MKGLLGPDSWVLRRDIVPHILVGLFAIGSTILGRSFTAVHPGEFDAQLFAVIGEQWRQGQIPYVDIWDNKPPGIFALVAVVFSLFPKSFTALAFAEGLFMIGCIGTVYGIMRNLRAPTAAVLFSTIVAAISINLVYFNQRGLFTEIFVLWPTALSMLFFIKAVQASFCGRWIFLAGVFAGAATLFKPPGLSPFLAQAVFMAVLATTNRCSWRTAVGSVALGVAGIFVAWIPALIYFGLEGAIFKMIDATILYNIVYAVEGKRDILTTISITVSAISPIFPMFVFLMFSCVMTILNRDGLKNNDFLLEPFLLILFWMFFDLAGAVAGGRGYHHYFLPFACSLSVAAGFAYWLLCERQASSNRSGESRWRWLVLGLMLAPLVYHQGSDLRRMASLLRGGSTTPYWETVASALSGVREPGDTLFTWNYWPGIYFATNMRSPTRFLSAHYLGKSPQPNDVIGVEILSDLARNRPSFVIEDNAKHWNFARQTGQYREFQRLLEGSYELIFRSSLFHIFRLRPEVADPTIKQDAWPG